MICDAAKFICRCSHIDWSGMDTVQLLPASKSTRNSLNRIKAHIKTYFFEIWRKPQKRAKNPTLNLLEFNK